MARQVMRLVPLFRALAAPKGPGIAPFFLLWLQLLLPMPGAAGETPLSSSPVLAGGQGHDGLRPVPIPNLAHTDEAVRQALLKARSDLDSLVGARGTSREELAEAFGEIGLLYHAHVVFEAAEVCYRNARLLAPNDFPWPYYLAYLHQQNGRLGEASENYRHARGIEPDHPQARLRLALIYVELARFDLAEPLLRASASAEGLAGAALFGLGKLALARREFEQAVQLLEQALAASPQATRVHYALAMAYRGVNDLERARYHLEQRGDAEPDIPDPLIDALSELSTGHRTLYHYAMSAVRRHRYDMAVKAFRDGLAMDADNVNARVSLARALYLKGDRDAARNQLEEALKGAPAHGLANFLMGVLHDEMGSEETAMAHYRKTLSSDPEHEGAHFFLANSLMRAGNYAQAANHFALSLRQAPGNTLARLREVLALAGAGAPHARVKGRLETAVARYPEDTAFAYFLALLLATSPDDSVRDGARALSIATRLYETSPIPEHAELLAMAYAELARFGQAAAAQEQAVAVAMSYERLDLLDRLQHGLAAYQAGRPSRIPWRGDRSLSRVPPNDTLAAFRDYPTGSPY